MPLNLTSAAPAHPLLAVQEERRGDDWYLFDLDHFVIMVRRGCGSFGIIGPARQLEWLGRGRFRLNSKPLRAAGQLLGVSLQQSYILNAFCVPCVQHADPKLSMRSRQALPGLPFEAQEDSDHLVIDAHKIGGWHGQKGVGR